MLSGFVHTHLRAALVAAVAVAALTVSAPAHANPGDLDPSFGPGGIVLSNLDTVKGSSIEDVAVEPDGRIVALERGYNNTDHLLRYLPDGTLDPSFDGDGIAVIPSQVWAGDVALQADGKILVSGGDASGSFTVARFLPSGAIDQDFDGDSGTANGIVHTNLTQDSDIPTAVAVNGQERIVVAGHAGHAPGASDAGIVRLLPDGRRDSSFSGDGMLVFDTPVEVHVWDVAVQGDGKVVIGGEWGVYPTADTLIQRFTEDGAPDAFGPGGSRRIIDAGGDDEAASVAVQSDGRVLVGSSTDGQDKLLRLTASGDLDASFGNGGELPLTYHLGTLALAPDGNIVLGGAGALDGANVVAVERRSPDGLPDPTFAGGLPTLTGAVPGEGAHANATVVAPDGKIVAVGATGAYPTSRGVLMRFKGRPDPEPTPVSTPATTVPAADRLALSGLRLTNRLFAVGRARTPRAGQAQSAARRRRGTAFVFRLNRAATVSIRVKRLVTTRTGPRARTVALLKRTAQAGGNRVRFSGRVGRRVLRPGRYRATLTAVDANGKRTKPQTLRFRVVRG